MISNIINEMQTVKRKTLNSIKHGFNFYITTYILLNKNASCIAQGKNLSRNEKFSVKLNEYNSMPN